MKSFESNSEANQDFLIEELYIYCGKNNIEVYDNLFDLYTMEQFDKSMSPAKLKKLQEDENNVWRYEEAYDEWVEKMANKNKILIELDDLLYIVFRNKKEFNKICKVLDKYIDEDYNIFE